MFCFDISCTSTNLMKVNCVLFDFSCGSTDAIRYLKHLLRNVLYRC